MRSTVAPIVSSLPSFSAPPPSSSSGDIVVVIGVCAGGDDHLGGAVRRGQLHLDLAAAGVRLAEARRSGR